MTSGSFNEPFGMASGKPASSKLVSGKSIEGKSIEGKSIASKLSGVSFGDGALKAENALLRARLEECEQRVASLMWVLGVIRRGVEWQEESPILRLIDRTLSHEEERGQTLGPNVARMSIRRATPAPAQYDLDSA